MMEAARCKVTVLKIWFSNWTRMVQTKRNSKWGRVGNYISTYHSYHVSLSTVWMYTTFMDYGYCINLIFVFHFGHEFWFYFKFHVGGNASSSSQLLPVLLREGDSKSSLPETKSPINGEALVKNNGNSTLQC